MEVDDYLKDLHKRQEDHLEKVRKNREKGFRPCLHDGCTQCHGTGVKEDGTPCIHMISCPCPKCSPTYM